MKRIGRRSGREGCLIDKSRDRFDLIEIVLIGIDMVDMNRRSGHVMKSGGRRIRVRVV